MNNGEWMLITVMMGVLVGQISNSKTELVIYLVIGSTLITLVRIGVIQ